MSSLRLALKQSLEEAGPSVNDGDKKRRNKKLRKGSVSIRGTRPGEPPKIKRKRGRPRKHPRPEDVMQQGGDGVVSNAGEATADGDGQYGAKHERSYDDEGSSSENEFSYDGEEDEENDDDSAGVDDGEDRQENEEEEDGNDEDDYPKSVEIADGMISQKQSTRDSRALLPHETSIDSHATDPDGAHSLAGEGERPNNEHRKQKKMLKKKLKHSAANKIQNQWKKKKGVCTEENEISGTSQQKSNDDLARPIAETGEESSFASSHLQSSTIPRETVAQPSEKLSVKKKRKKVAGVVPPPSAEVLEWSRNMTEKQCRAHVQCGLRVKVRFSTDVKKDGKLIKRKKWYGGRIVKVSPNGTKIKIKYDDTTAEVAKFPDDDIVVDAVMNGEHSAPVAAFLPPSSDDMESDEMEEGELKSTLPEDPGSSTNEVSESDVISNSKKELKNTELLSVSTKNTENESGQQIIEPVKTVHEMKTPVAKPAHESVEMVEPSESTVAAILASPEEGELSPGITSKRREVVDVPETKAMLAPESGCNDSDKQLTTNNDEVASHSVSEKTTSGEVGGTVTTAKLAIQLPVQETTKDASSPKPSPRTLVDREIPVDKVLVDTLVDENGSKRKREPSEVVEDEPPKQKSKEASEIFDVKVQDDIAVGGESGPNESTSVVDSKDEEMQKTSSIKSDMSLQNSSSEVREVDLAPPQHQGKKKKKKSERAKSPRPRSPLPKRATSPTRMGEVESMDSSRQNISTSEPKNQIASVGNSAEIVKGELEDVSTQPSLKNVPSVDSFGGTSRSGRKAAQQAKEKLSTKDKDTLVLDLNKKKKKRRKMEEADTVEGVDDTTKGPEWVQCDSCGKWRILPSDVKVSSLPKHWYCHMNIYDPKRNTCEAPEQTAKQALKERKRAMKKAKRMEAIQMGKADQATTPVNSPKPTKGVKNAAKMKEIAESKKKGLVLMTEEQRSQSDSASESQKEEKKKGKKNKSKDIGEEVAEAPVEVKKPGRKRGRPARNQTSSTSQPPNRDSQDEDNVEWVQCEKCEKWRKLPPDISADELPDTWYCSMNTWNSSSASCEAPEDKTDAQHHEVGSSEWQLRQTHAGKYSYRQMIFGTGAKKQNRPLSERSRAAESLFVKPVDEKDENPIPTTQYSKSSAFLPRISNFNKASNLINEENLGIFDVLSNSNLWAQLRAMEQVKPMKVESGTLSSGSYPKFVTYENLPDDIKTAMQGAVLEILGNSALLGDAVIQEACNYPWEDKTIVAFCNADVVINTLLALVRDGIVEMATARDQNIPMSQWIPKYRRVRSKRALAAEEAIKSSKCMKISKPWKQREDSSTEWLTGQKAFQ